MRTPKVQGMALSQHMAVCEIEGREQSEVTSRLPVDNAQWQTIPWPLCGPVDDRLICWR